MTKSELLTQIEANSLGIVRVDQQETGALQNGKTFTKYNVNVLAKEGDSQNFKNIPFTVINEGQAGEEAFLTQGQKEPTLDAVRKAVSTYVKTIAGVLRFEIASVNEDTKDARVTAIVDNGNGTASQKNFMVYKNGTSPITHVEII